MPYLDRLLELSAGQGPITATAVTTSSVDTLNDYDIGIGNDPLGILFTVTTAASGGTSVAFEIVDDDNAALSSPATLASSGAIPVASLVVGYQVVVVLPDNVKTQRYIGGQYTVTGAVTLLVCDAEFGRVHGMSQANNLYIGT